MNEIKLFENPEFGQVRIQMVDGEPMFCLSDVAKCLGYSRPADAISTHCKGVSVLPTPTNGGVQNIKFGKESNIYRLVMKSKLPYAERFQDWVCEEVLPSVRKTLTTLESITYSGNIDGIVYSKDGKPTTTSRIIANVFNRNHKDILEAIDNKVNSKNESIAEFSAMNIKSVMYLSDNGKTYREYELTEDGFSFIALGLTGEKADEYKIKYIEAFGRMRNAITNMFKAKILDEVLPQDSKLRQYVYVIKNPYSELIKIGVARDVSSRLKQLQTGAGIELELIYKSMLCSNAFKIESIAHDHFKEERKFGEWFNVSPQDVISFIEKQEFILNSQFNILYHSNK